MRADRRAEDRDALDEPPHPARRRDADRVGEDELAGPAEPLAELGDRARVDLALERAAPGARDRDRAGRSATASTAFTRSTASSSDALPLRRLNVSVAASVQFDPVDRGRREPLPAAQVEDEAGELGARRARTAATTSSALGHLRDAVGADE